jgi:hypothetical protein
MGGGISHSNIGLNAMQLQYSWRWRDDDDGHRKKNDDDQQNDDEAGIWRWKRQWNDNVCGDMFTKY